jgi:hypothetical protein
LAEQTLASREALHDLYAPTMGKLSLAGWAS